jgi:MFS family permease
VRTKLGTTFRSLRVRNYRLFATGQLIKLIGVWTMITAQDWLVLELSDDSATALGIVTALQFVPMLLFTLYGGKLADRHDKRMLLAVANAAYAVLSIMLAALVAIGVVELWHVFVFAAAMGVANAIETPVRQAFVSELVGTALLPNALSLSAATFNTARIVGPAVAGISIAAMGTGPVFLLSTVLGVAPVFTYARMRAADLHREALPPVEERNQARIVDGLRYVWQRGDLLLPIVMMAIVGMIGFNFPVTLAALAKTGFQTGAASFGVFSTALAVGALGGALAGSWRKGRPSAYVVLGAAVAFGALETLAGFAGVFWLTAVLLVPTGFFMVFFAQAANQRVQLGTDAAYRGRVMALYIMVFLGTTPLGAPLIGWIAEHVGPGPSVWIGGMISLATALVALAAKLRSTGERVRLRLWPAPRFYVVPTGNSTLL